MQTQNVNVGVLAPGDWDVSVSFWPTTQLQGVSFMLAPQPTGVSTNMAGMARTGGPLTGVTDAVAVVHGQPARALLSVPTLFSFTVTTNLSGTATPGTGWLALQARRIR
jgi:hypothetical protein